MVRLVSYILLLCFANIALGDELIISAPSEKYFGDDDVRISIKTQYAKEIAEVEKYLNSFETFMAQFKQSNKEGSVRYGKFFISKPGKIRCEYVKPTPDLLIINENKLTFYDKALDEVSYASADINSLKILALKDLRFNSVHIVEMEKDDHFLTISLKEHVEKLESPLFLTMKFSYPQIELKQITITTKDSEMDLIFDQIIYNQPIGKQLFYFHRDIFKNRR
jgi:outer membrane lipoprotein carrier protein